MQKTILLNFEQTDHGGGKSASRRYSGPRWNEQDCSHSTKMGCGPADKSLRGRLAGHLFKNQGNVFLLWSSCFFMILSFQELQWNVILINFHLFSLFKSILKKNSFWSIWIKQEPVEIDLKLIFLNIDLSKENKWKLINQTLNWSSRKLKIIKKIIRPIQKISLLIF